MIMKSCPVIMYLDPARRARKLVCPNLKGKQTGRPCPSGEKNQLRTLPRHVHEQTRGTRSCPDFCHSFDKQISLSPPPVSIRVFNVVATAMITVGVFASLDAGYLNLRLRVTANNIFADN